MSPIRPFALHLRSYAADGAEHRHDFSQLVLPVRGRLQLDIGGRERVLREGQAAFVESGMRHSQAGQGAHRALVVDLDNAQLSADFAERMASRPFVTVSPAAYRLIDYMGCVLQGGAAAADLAQHWVPLMLDALACMAPRPVARLGGLMALVHADPGRRWTTEDMAREACVSVSRLHALFRAELDTTPAAWLSQQRLQRVREWLAHTERPIAELALAAGYADQNALTRAMRRTTGLTPAAWRRQARDRA